MGKDTPNPLKIPEPATMATAATDYGFNHIIKYLYSAQVSVMSLTLARTSIQLRKR